MNTTLVRRLEAKGEGIVVKPLVSHVATLSFVIS